MDAQDRSLLRSAFHFVENHCLFGKFAGLELRVDHCVVHSHLKAPAASRDELERRNPLFEPNEKLFRQTDGTGLVPSLAAILDTQTHRILLSG